MNDSTGLKVTPSDLAALRKGINTNMKELNLNEMEQANGGSIIGLICVLSLGGGAIGSFSRRCEP